ncbi:MFS transporter [Alkaliphilus oremlandii]|uniref:Major facilitator superfamily MFS_1 n=1 Tax=Alkaliphilus oremlandii (strain OhILAs) TaxID=350688 RepID=A8MII1_ALKOO|nr:MFS transporter [Alkaliphilus oremlandii]ABW19613.1 major facilitator superfamily MFS_1 [Alkaliphilus oremlandii OhILAs]
MTKSQNNRLIILTFFVMALLGFLESIRGAVIPSIQGFYGIGYKDIGIFLFIASLGYISSNFFGASMSYSLGQKKLIFIGTLCIAAGIVGMFVSQNFILFLFFVAILNYGYGTFSISANTLTPIIFEKNQGMMMNLLHFFYGLGATLGPRYAGIALKNHWSWQKIYSMNLPVLIIFLALALMSIFPRIEEKDKEEKSSFKAIISNPEVLLFSFILGFYVAAELGVANWLTTYLQDGKKIDPVQSATYLSLFFGIFAFGRLVGGFIVEKLGYFKSILGFLITAAVLFTAGTIFSNQWIFLISLSGFFFSIIYPTTFALLLKVFGKEAGKVMGVVITISSGLNMIGNAIIGQMNDIIGLEFGFRLVTVYLLISIILIFILKKRIGSQVQ